MEGGGERQVSDACDKSLCTMEKVYLVIAHEVVMCDT
jgi:hypothetical protein